MSEKINWGNWEWVSDPEKGTVTFYVFERDMDFADPELWGSYKRIFENEAVGVFEFTREDLKPLQHMFAQFKKKEKILTPPKTVELMRGLCSG